MKDWENKIPAKNLTEPFPDIIIITRCRINLPHRQSPCASKDLHKRERSTLIGAALDPNFPALQGEQKPMQQRVFDLPFFIPTAAKTHTNYMVSTFFLD